MARSAREFFEQLPGRIDPARTIGRRASYRFDVAGAGSWRVGIEDGTVDVRETDEPADCVVKASEETFLRVVQGEQNPTTAFFTGKIKVEGDVGLAMRLRDLLA